MSDEFEAASAAVRRGLLVVLPTDTIYGIGALPRSHGGVAGIFEAKGRPMEKPIPVLAANAEDLYDVVVFDDRARRGCRGSVARPPFSCASTPA